KKGLNAPYVEAVVKKLRPEGPGRPGADHPGYGTLFFAMVNDKLPKEHQKDRTIYAPAGLVVRGEDKGISLSWIKSRNAADTYIIKRASSLAGPFKIIA